MLLSAHFSHIYLMMYNWVTSPVDQVAALSGFKMVLQMWLAETIWYSHSCSQQVPVLNAKSQYTRVLERFVRVCCTGKSNVMETLLEATTSHSKAVNACAYLFTWTNCCLNVCICKPSACKSNCILTHNFTKYF